jgi:hypothetical protein
MEALNENYNKKPMLWIDCELSRSGMGALYGLDSTWANDPGSGGAREGVGAFGRPSCIGI